MTNDEIANKHGVTRFFVQKLIVGKRKTDIPDLAMDIGRKYKTVPAKYLGKKIKSMALQINPKLGKKSD